MLRLAQRTSVKLTSNPSAFAITAGRRLRIALGVPSLVTQPDDAGVKGHQPKLPSTARTVWAHNFERGTSPAKTRTTNPPILIHATVACELRMSVTCDQHRAILPSTHLPYRAGHLDGVRVVDSERIDGVSACSAGGTQRQPRR